VHGIDIDPEEIARAVRRRAIEMLRSTSQDTLPSDFEELAELVDKEFATACVADYRCAKTWREILETAEKLDEEVENEVAKEIAEILLRNGIEVEVDHGICRFRLTTKYPLLEVDAEKVHKMQNKLLGVLEE